jgi:putative membrane protein
MPEALKDILADWSCPLWLTLFVVVAAAIYIRGWQQIRKTRPKQFTVLRLASFLGGLAILWLALGSPLDGIADALLSAHMVEHLLLMSAVPPLLLLGLPVVPLLRGLPISLRRSTVPPLIRLLWLRRVGYWLVKPLVAWLLMNISFLAWHIPGLYDFALEHEGWHVVEHICFLTSSLLFWWCVLRPWPAPANRRNWSILLYLIAADVVNTLLSAFLSFCGRPIYRYYLSRPNVFHRPPLEDQVLGAVIMWVLGSIAFLLPAMLITFQMLQSKRSDLEESSSPA